MGRAKLLACVGVGLAAVLLVFSILTIGLYAGAADLSDSSCSTAAPRERTSGMGITAGVVGFFASIFILPLFLFPIFSSALAKPSFIFNFFIIILAVLVAIFYLVAWALMAKDIDDIRSAEACGSPPGVWGAALAFALLASLVAIAIGCLAAASLIAVRSGEDYSLLPNNA